MTPANRHAGEAWSVEPAHRLVGSPATEAGAWALSKGFRKGSSRGLSWRSVLGLESKRTEDPATSLSVGNQPSIEEQRLVETLDGLVRSKFSATPFVDGRLGETLGRVVRLVKTANNTCLRAVAQLGLQACEAAINIGWVYNDARDVAQSTVSISSAVEEMASSITELSSSSDMSASQAENARDTMRSCINDSRGAADAMDTIEKRSRNIEERLGVLQGAVDQISDMAGKVEVIAQQSNLLALNATIEAARAGEHGRGFVVVASEVKALSVETRKATKEIHARVATLTEEMKGIRSAVKDSLKSVDAGSAVVRQVGAIIEGVGNEVSEVADRIRGLSDLLQQQRHATSEIAENTLHISEKANKTKDEVEAIGRRLQDCEVVAEKALDSASEWPVENLGLIRFAADASAWKRGLSSILLGTVPAPERAPELPSTHTLADAQQCCAAHPADKALLAELARAIDDAQKNSAVIVNEVRKANWGAATPAYIACEEALKKAIAATDKLSQFPATLGP